MSQKQEKILNQPTDQIPIKEKTLGVVLDEMFNGVYLFLLI